METIIYFENKRGLSEPSIEPIGMKTYLLVRVSLNVESEKWFDVNLCRPEWMNIRTSCGEHLMNMEDAYSTASQVDMSTGDIVSCQDTISCEKKHIFYLLRSLMESQRIRRKIRQRQQLQCERRYEQLREYHLQLEQWRGRVRTAEEAILRMQSELSIMWEPGEPVWAVYEEQLQKILFSKAGFENGDGRLQYVWNKIQHPCRSITVSDLWNQHITLHKFQAYYHPFWIKQILPKDMPQHIWVVGRSISVNSILEQYMKRLKSIFWMLPEQDCDNIFLEQLEDFYEESGMVISYRTYSNLSMLCRDTVECLERTLILDFTGGENLPNARLAKGSIWLDIYSNEIKRKKVQSRFPTGIYLSLNIKWKQAQKSHNKPFVLDITEGNGYNTWESEGMLNNYLH